MSGCTLVPSFAGAAPLPGIVSELLGVQIVLSGRFVALLSWKGAWN
jgi:hypothetical protein